MSPFTRAYYGVKPLISWRLRMGVRRWFAVRKRRRMADRWPILETAGRTPEGWPGWPAGHQFGFVITHDVESSAGVANVRRLAELEMSLGFRSSFNFIPEGGYETPGPLRDWLVANGFEVGVHDLKHDGKLYDSRAGFRRRAARINDHALGWNAVGFRSGFMLHNYEWLHDLNVLYDASSFDTDPFEPQPDGVGTIFPFWIPRVSGGKERTTNNQPRTDEGYIELPYTLPQDSTLFLLFRETSDEIWRRKLEWIVAHRGMALMSVHPDYVNFNDRSSGDSRRFSVACYAGFLVHVRSRYSGLYWHALPREVALFARQALVPEFDEGLGSAPAPAVPMPATVLSASLPGEPARPAAVSVPTPHLAGKRVASVVFSHYPYDPRPRRAAEAMRDAGMSVDVVCLRQSDREAAWEEGDSIRVRRLPLTRRRGGKWLYLWQYASFIASVSWLLAWRSMGRRYHLVHVHNMPDVLVFSALIPRLLGAKVILDLHDPMPELMMTIFDVSSTSRSVAFLQRLERWSIAFADRVLTVNLACRKIFSRRSCRAEKVDVVMNSPDERIFGPEPRPPVGRASAAPLDRPFVIMCHGSIVERHGIDLGVRALQQLGRTLPRVELRIFGHRTPFLEQVMDLAREIGVADQVQYRGGMNLEQIVAAIDEADLGIIPNRRSIFTELNTPTRIFEYLARGIPVIAPRAPGIQDYFGEDSMIYFELGDVGDLARKMEWAMRNPEAVRVMVLRGQEVYRAHQWRAERAGLLRVTADLLAPVRP